MVLVAPPSRIRTCYQDGYRGVNKFFGFVCSRSSQLQPLLTKDIITMTTCFETFLLMGLWDVGANLLQPVPNLNPRTLLRTMSVITDAFLATYHRHQLPCKAIRYGVLGIPCRTQLAIPPESPHLTCLIPSDAQRHQESVTT